MTSSGSGLRTGSVAAVGSTGLGCEQGVARVACLRWQQLESCRFAYYGEGLGTRIFGLQ